MKITSKNVAFVDDTIEHTEFKECNENVSLLDTWKENADFILHWADNVLIHTNDPERQGFD